MPDPLPTRVRSRRHEHTGSGDPAAGGLVVHDYSGHPFQVQLSRWFASQGVPTVHIHCPSFQTPKGHLALTDEDPTNFGIRGVALRKAFVKYSPLRRFTQEFEYGIRLARKVRRQKPTVVISSNTPLLAAGVFHLAMKLSRIPVVFWQQDVYSVAMTNHAQRILPRVGRPVGWGLRRLERCVARSSASVVTISEDFGPILRSWGVPEDDIHVIENWAPLGEIPVRPKNNGFAQEHDLADKFVLLYAGTLGLKHDPSLLLRLAEHFSSRPDVRVVVASEGRGADWLRANGAGLSNLVLLPFQPYEKLPDLLGTADVVVVILEPDAGIFSVPSKVLTYHCAQRPILGAVPSDNLAARIIEREHSGVCVPPGDAQLLVEAADRLVSNRDLASSMGHNGRAYAEATFDIERIGKAMWSVVEGFVGPLATRESQQPRAEVHNG